MILGFSSGSGGSFRISTDKTQLDVGRIYEFLSQQAYWAIGRSYETVARSIASSLCFGVYDGEEQVGFARVVTDTATFAWLCDVFVIDSRARPRDWANGWSNVWWRTPTWSTCAASCWRRVDADELYRQYGGFSLLKAPERWMERLAQ